MKKDFGGKDEVMTGNSDVQKKQKNQNKQKMEWLRHTKKGGLQPWLSNDLSVLRTTERWVHRKHDSWIRINPKFPKRNLC